MTEKEKHDMEIKIADLASNEKIAIPQAKKLAVLLEQGYDIEPALKGRIEGFDYTTAMVQYVKDGNADAIAKLIEDTAKEDAVLERTAKWLDEMGF